MVSRSQLRGSPVRRERLLSSQFLSSANLSSSAGSHSLPLLRQGLKEDFPLISIGEFQHLLGPKGLNSSSRVFTVSFG